MMTKKEIFHKACLGLLCGLAFGLPFWGVYCASHAVFRNQIHASFEKHNVITSHNMVERGYSRVVLGTLKNEGNRSKYLVGINMLLVQVNLYDSDGRFVWQCRPYPTYEPSFGESKFFRVFCEGSEEKPLPSFERYEVELTSM